MDGGRAAPLQARLSVWVSVLLLNQTCSSVDRPGGIQLPRCTPPTTTTTPLSLAPSPSPSLPPPPLQQRLSPSRLAHSPSPVPYPWGSGAEQTNTRESIFSPSFSLPLCFYLSIPRSMSPWPACSANKWRAMLSVGRQDTGKGCLERKKLRHRRGRSTEFVLAPQVFLITFSAQFLSFSFSSSSLSSFLSLSTHKGQ